MLKKFPPAAAIFIQILFFAFAGAAQVSEYRIKIVSANYVQIEGKLPGGQGERFLSFLETYADAGSLSSRIENLKMFDHQNREVAFRKIADGTFQAEKDFFSLSYRVKLTVPENTLSAVHISWLSENQGLLMLNDLLPGFDKKFAANVSFGLPAGWTISASEKSASEKSFQVNDIENSVFLVGKDLRSSKIPVGETVLNVSAAGKWNFEISEAGKMAGEILAEYQKIFGEIPFKTTDVFLLRFPGEVGFERWRAETRGSNVTILSSPTNFPSLEIQRFHEQLRHELFHLWIPNSLHLSGDYAWFYEGFAQYAALRTGVELNRITFSDFLNTLEQAVNLSSRRSQPISLLEASKSRWNGENSSVYARGMLVAFLADVALLREGKDDLLKIFRQVYQKHNLLKNQSDGNAAILETLQSRRELVPVVENYIKGAEKIDLKRDLNATGIEAIPSNNGQKLQIKAKLSGREKDLLNKLGYNNWRKSLRSSK